MNYRKPSFTKESDPNRQLNWYDLKELLFQAIKKQFRFVPPPVKNQLKKLSPAQLESVLDILPQFSEIQYLETHLTELSQKHPPEHDKDRFRPPAPSFDRQHNREFRPSPPPPRSEEAVEVPRRIEPPEVKPAPVQERVIDEPVTPKIASEPEQKDAPAPAPVPVQPVQLPPSVGKPSPPKHPLPAPTPAMAQPWVNVPPTVSADVVRTTIPVSIGEKQLDLVFEYDRFADRENHRGVRFSFSMDEMQFLLAQLLTQRERIQPIEPRVAQAIQSFFGEAEQVLRGALQTTQPVSGAKPETTQPPGFKTEPVSTSDPLTPGVKMENVAANPAPVQRSLPIEFPGEDVQTSQPAADTSSTDELPRKRHRRTNQELAAAGIPVGKRTRLTSEKIDLDSLKFDPRLASILSIDQARALNIAPVSFLEDSTDVLVLFVEREGKVRIYTYFNRAANRAALAALAGIPPENREQVKIRTFRVSQEYLNQFLNEAASILTSADVPTPTLEGPAGTNDTSE